MTTKRLFFTLGILGILAGVGASAEAATITRTFGNQPRTVTVFDFGVPVSSPRISFEGLWCWEDGGNGGCFTGAKEIGVGDTGNIFLLTKDDGGRGAAGPNCAFASGNPNAFDYCASVIGSSFDGRRLSLEWEGITDRDINSTFGKSYLTRIAATATETSVSLPSISIIASPTTLLQGNSAVIYWTTVGAASCAASGAWSGSKSTSGSEVVSPSMASTYILTCRNAAGEQSASVTLQVTQNQQSAAFTQFGGTQTFGSFWSFPSVTLNAAPSSIVQGNSATLIWNSQGATSCQAFGGWSGSKALSGSETVSPNQSTSYAVTCSSGVGSATDTKTVFVQQTGLVGGVLNTAPAVQLSATPGVIGRGSNSLLSWSSGNATACLASGGWSGNKLPSGAEYVSPSNTTTYTITCTGPGGALSDSRTIVVQSVLGVATGAGSVIQFSKLARNTMLNQSQFANAIEAQGIDILEFQILVRNAGSQATQVEVRDQLPGDLFYTPGSTKINGVSAPDGIVAGGLALGALNPGEERRVKFQAVVFFGVKPKIILNQAIVKANSATQTGTATITIKNRGKVLPGSITTGPEAKTPLIIGGGFAGAMLLYFLSFRIRFGKKPIYSLSRDAKLIALIKDIKKKEKFSDTEL